MTLLKIACHHGSPGNARDFLHLKLITPELHFVSPDRVLENQSTELSECVYQLGYSFGCYHALIEANKNPKTKIIFLVAPYLFIDKKISPIMKSLLGFGVFKNQLLPKLANAKIEKMLLDSSHPKRVPKHYKKDAETYLEGERLAHSLLEKDIDQGLVEKTLQELEKKNIPIIVIYGDSDLTSKKDQQISPLLKYQNVSLSMIQNGGHALIWTHTEELSKIINSTLGIDHQEQDNLKERIGYFSGSDKRNNVASFLNEHKAKFPNERILSWVKPEDLKNWNGDIHSALPHQSVTVAQLDLYVGVLSHEFKKCGIKFNDRVILFLPMSLYMYAAMFALQKMGAIPTFLDSWARRDQMGVSAKVANPSAMISADRAFVYLDDVPEIHDIKIKIVAGPIASEIQYSAKLEELLQGKIYDEEVAVEKEHTALITFTTGSSGTPKGADRSHRFLAAQHYALNRHLPYTKSDKDLPVFPIFSLNNLAAGVETIIPAIDVGAPAETDAKVLYAQLKSSSVTCTTLSPSLFNSLATFCIDQKLNLDFLKRVVTGGAPISRDDVKRMKSVATKAEILVLYGSTEVEPMAHIEAVEMLTEAQDSDLEIVEAGVNVGKIDSGLKYKFIHISKDNIFINKDEDWKSLVVNSGDVGELIVAGEHVCEKYFNNEEAFFRAKIKDKQNIIWHRTGDLGFVDQYKNWWIVGRVHNAINRDHKYYFPVRAEIILKKFPFVNKAAFLGIPDSKLIEKTFAVFTTNKDHDDIDTYKIEIKRVMEKNGFVIDEVVHIDEIPMDPRHHSKVEYDILRKKLVG